MDIVVRVAMYNLINLLQHQRKRIFWVKNQNKLENSCSAQEKICTKADPEFFARGGTNHENCTATLHAHNFLDLDLMEWEGSWNLAAS